MRQYVEIDLKSSNMNVNVWGKIMHEVKEYFEKVYVHVESYYQKELLWGCVGVLLFIDEGNYYKLNTIDKCILKR